MRVWRLDHKYWLLLIFVAVLALRLFFVFQTDYLSPDSYFAVRQVDSILDSGIPVFEDDLSYSGRINLFLPTYYYILAGGSVVLGQLMAFKILPALFISLFVIVAFLLARELTGNTKVSLLISLFAGIVPSFFSGPLNSASPLDLFLPLMFFCMYCFLKANDRLYLYFYVMAIFLLSILSPLAFLFVFGLIVFMILMRLDYKKQNRVDLELSLFSIFLILWVQMIFHKNAFLFHGFSVVWQNIPATILTNYFADISLIDVIYGIGLIPLLFGIFTVYKYILKEKNRHIYFVVAFALAVGLLLWLKMIAVTTGLVFLGATLVVLSAPSFKALFIYFDKTKASKLRTLLWLAIIVVFCFTSLVSVLAWGSDKVTDAPSDDEMAALAWLGANAGNESVVLASADEGFMINSIAGSKNVADTRFLLIKDADVVFEDMDLIYNTKFETRAIELLDKYHVDYIYASPRTLDGYGIEEIAYVGDDRCFPLVYNVGVEIFEVRCHVKDD